MIWIIPTVYFHLPRFRASLPSADADADAFPVPEPWIDDAEFRGMEQAGAMGF